MFNFSLTAYGLGLLVTFAGLYLMAVAQPALLYLVPCTLIPVFLLGLIRHEWRLLWEGDSQVCLLLFVYSPHWRFLFISSYASLFFFRFAPSRPAKSPDWQTERELKTAVAVTTRTPTWRLNYLLKKFWTAARIAIRCCRSRQMLNQATGNKQLTKSLMTSEIFSSPLVNLAFSRVQTVRDDNRNEK